MEGFAFRISQKAEALSICLTVKRLGSLLLCSLARLYKYRTLDHDWDRIFPRMRTHGKIWLAHNSWACGTELKTIKPEKT